MNAKQRAIQSSQEQVQRYAEYVFNCTQAIEELQREIADVKARGDMDWALPTLERALIEAGRDWQTADYDYAWARTHHKQLLGQH